MLNLLIKAFLFPGSMMLKFLDITPEEDGGILRSFVNMIFWGVVMTVLAFKVFL